MAERKKGRKTIKQNFYLFNMVIQPVERQASEAYVDLFRRIFKLGQSVQLSKKYHLRMMSVNIASDNTVFGSLVKYQDNDNREEGWYNSETNAYQDVDLAKNLHPDFKEIKFYFFPHKHRLVVENYLTSEQVRTYFDKLLAMVTDGTGMSVAFNVVKSEQGISNIASNQHLTKLEICISYTNSDIFDGWERLIDEDNKNTNVENFKVTATGRPDRPINVAANKFLMTILALSKENGSVKAIEQTQQGTKTISSEKSPKNIGIRYPDGESPIEALRKTLFGSVI